MLTHLARGLYYTPIGSLPLDSPLAQIVVGIVLMIANGSTFALGVFTLPVQLSAPPHCSYLGIWPSAMGLMHALSSPAMILTGLAIDGSAPSRRTQTAKKLSIACSVCFGMLALSAVGLTRSWRWMIALGVMVQAVPLGVYYTLVTEHLFVWLPKTPGFAVALGQMAFGMGSIVVAWLFDTLVKSVGLNRALVTSAAILGLPTFLAGICVRWPSEQVSSPQAESQMSSEELSPILGDGMRKLHWSRLTLTPEFWLYMVAVLSAGASYAFIPYYFKLGARFGASSNTLVKLFQITSVAATLFGMASSVWTEKFRTQGRGGCAGFFSSGSKNVMALFLGAQTGLFLVLIPICSSGAFVPFVVVVAVLKMIMASHAGCAVLLARDMFGEKNGCVVFGVGGGITLGLGEGISAGLMAAVEQWAEGAGYKGSAGDFNAFYVVSAVWSLVGTISVLWLCRCRAAIEDGLPTTVRQYSE